MTNNGTTGFNASTAAQSATIGAAVTIKGEISGKEDILIEGAVEGLVNLKQNSVTVAKSGKVRANVHGLVILVEGEVVGDLFGTERVIVRQSGRVHGNITSPKVAIEEGSRVRGSLNTDVDDTTEHRVEMSRTVTRTEAKTEDMAAASAFKKAKDSSTILAS